MGDGVWRTSVLAHTATADNQYTIEVQNDLSACFGSVNRQSLWDRAVELHYPLAILRVSLMSYSWRRFVSLDGIVAGSSLAFRGIVAGSQFAIPELKSLFCAGLQEVVRLSHQLGAFLY